MPDRKKYFGGSDAYRLMKGDWAQLWLEKTGRVEPEDLSGVFKVQLGIYTEQFHADWLAEKMHYHLRRVEWAAHPDYPYLAGTPDRWDEDADTFLDLKHSNDRASPRSITETYLPQMAHYGNIHARRHCLVSTIPGNDEPFVTKIDIPVEYMEELLDHELRFWWHVENDVVPDIIPTAGLAATNELVKQAKVDGFRFVDMKGNNAWAAAATQLLDTKDAHKAHEDAKTELKGLVEADVGEATGYGITIKRDKRGALRFTFDKEN